MSKRSVEQLRDELRQVDADLARLSVQERDVERGIGELSLQARRGDQQAATKLNEYDAFCIESLNTRRRLRAARYSIEGELQVALALERSEETKAKAREAKKIVALLRHRGAAIDATIFKLIGEYDSIAADVNALVALGASQINLRLVQLGCERALRAKLMSIKELELRPVAPLERREFASLTDGWAAGAERWINSILKADEPTTPAGADPPFGCRASTSGSVSVR
jgi:hypothetical protein